MREEIAAEYHTCLMPYRAKLGTSDMFHRWIGHVQWSQTWQFIDEVELYITPICIHNFITLKFRMCMSHMPSYYQYYKWWVGYDLCVTRNYCVLSSTRRQSTWPIRFLRGRSSYRCVTCLTLHELWTKFWNAMLLKIILFSPMSSLTPADSSPRMR
jgi:hypothetical protein